MDKFYITTSIAYVNARPHIGFAMELIQADALARHHRMLQKEVFFLTGTDEHGTKLVQTAKDEGMTPKELVDQNAPFFEELTKQMNISNNDFIRTTSDLHKRGAQKLWRRLAEVGDLYKDSYEGLYCVGCEAFVLEKDLVDGKCPNHNKEPQKLKEENWFFKLSKYSEQIGKLIESGELTVVPQSRKNEILSLIEDGLKDVSFSRPKKVLPWGIDVPDDPDHVMYVWCEALPNYITAIGYEEETEQFKKLWPADVHLIGKDILRFHAGIWIGILLSAGLSIPKAVYAHGFITSEGKKMSKSLGNVVDPVEYTEKYGADALRYFLLKEIPTTDDGDFSRERFKVVYETELANNVGNLVSRVLAMNAKYFDGKVPPAGSAGSGEARVREEVKSLVNGLVKNYEQAFSEFDLKRALEQVCELAMFANRFVEETKPWVLAKEEKTQELADALYNLLETIRILAVLLFPFVPQASEKIITSLFGEGNVHFSLGTPTLESARLFGSLKEGEPLPWQGEPLFARIDV